MELFPTLVARFFCRSYNYAVHYKILKTYSFKSWNGRMSLEKCHQEERDIKLQNSVLEKVVICF